MTDSVSNTEELDPDEGGELPPEEPDPEVLEDDVTDATAEEVDEMNGSGGDEALDEGVAEAEDLTFSEEGSDEVDAQSETDDGAESESELEVLQAEHATLNDRHLRLAAEFNNFRRRTEAERLSAWSRAQADLVAKFLDVLDDLHRVAELDLSNATVEAIMEGIDLVEKKFVREIAEAGAEMHDPVGEAFDPERMEAMMKVPIDDPEQDDTVAAVFQKGYSLKGILVRPARVSVHKHG